MPNSNTRIKSGKVNTLHIGRNTSWVILDTGDFFLLWNYNSSSPPRADERLMHSTWLSMLKDAMIHDKNVSLHSDTESAIIHTVEW
jgi:hypothetical protein